MKFIRKEETGFTAVPNRFIDEAMPAADGEFVKLYLLLLRLPAGEISLAALAERLQTTEPEAERSIRYWQRQNLLQAERDADGNILSLEVIGDGASAAKERNAELTREEKRAAALEALGGKPEAVQPAEGERTQERRSYLPSEVAQIRDENPEFQELLFVAETYLGKTLTMKETEIFAYLYGELHFPEPVLEYLIEYCVENDHKNIAYIEKTALNWHAEGKMTLDEVKAAGTRFAEEHKAVARTMGISGRVLTEEERRQIASWRQQLQMPLELIEEACRRTIEAIHEPSFRYAEAILKSWYEQGADTPEKVNALQPKKKQAAGRKQSFNFDQRQTDYDAYLRQEG